MKIKLLAVGKTDDKNLEALFEKYRKRLGYYVNFSVDIIPDIRNSRNLSFTEQKRAEGESILKRIQDSDQVILLDERGKAFRSVELARDLQKKMNAGVRTLVLVIGGPYGFSEPVYKRANAEMSLSKMTFSHQMIRIFLVEQLYRAFTILKNEPYHHE